MTAIDRMRDNLRRALAGRSQQSIADEVGVSRQMVNYYLRGSATPSLEMCERLADAAGLTLSELFAKNGRPKRT